jgi:hypothetical protein
MADGGGWLGNQMMGSPKIDFLRPIGIPRIGWGLLLVGVLAVALTARTIEGWQSGAAQREATMQHELAARDAAFRAARRPKPTSADDRLAQLVANRMRQPWIPALRAIEEVTGSPVFLLELSIDPETGLVKLRGEAPSFDHALAYAQRLDEGGALAPATLLSHETIADQDPVNPIVRFDVATRWIQR